MEIIDAKVAAVSSADVRAVSAGTATAELGTPMALHSATREPAKAHRDNSLALLIGVCSVAFLLRLALACYIVSHYGVVRVYGGFESCRIAASIVSGHGFSSPYGIPTGPTAWLPPVYPYLVAAVFKVLGVYLSLIHISEPTRPY